MIEPWNYISTSVFNINLEYFSKKYTYYVVAHIRQGKHIDILRIYHMKK